MSLKGIGAESTAAGFNFGRLLFFVFFFLMADGGLTVVESAVHGGATERRSGTVSIALGDGRGAEAMDESEQMEGHSFCLRRMAADIAAEMVSSGGEN